MTPETKTQIHWKEKHPPLDGSEDQLVKKLLLDTLQKPRKQLSARDLEELIEIKATNRVRDGQLKGLFQAIGLVISLLLIIGAFEWKTYTDQDLVNLDYNAANFEEIAEIPLTEQPPPPPPSNNVPVIFNEVPDETIIEEIKVDLDVEITTEMAVDDVVFAPLEEPEEEEADEIFTIVEEQPQPVGGYEAFYAAIVEHLKFPDQARRAGVEGKVFLQFVVRPDGNVSDIAVAKGIGFGCDEAAMNALTAGPKWEPGKQRGRPVKVRVIVPIVFKLAK